MTTRKSLLAAALVALLPFAAQAQDANTGFYVGGKVGSASIDEDNLDDDDTSAGIYGGFRFNDYFGVEAEYSRFGTLEGEAGTGVDRVLFDTDPSSFAVKAVGYVPIGEQFSLLGNVGWHAYDLDTNTEPDLDDDLFEDSDNDLTYGIGGQFDFANQWALRANWQRYRFDDADLDELSLGVQYTF